MKLKQNDYGDKLQRRFRTHHHGIRVAGVVGADKDVNHQTARGAQQVGGVINQIDAKVGGFANGGKIVGQPGHIARVAGILQTGLDPEQVGASLHAAGNGVVGRVEANKMVRELARRLEKSTAALQHQADLLLQVRLASVQQGGQLEESVRIIK